MRHGFALAATALLAACGQDSAPPPANDSAAATAVVAEPVAATSRQIGETSALSGSASSLAGAVSDFQVTRTDTETRVSLAADTLFDFDKAVLTPAAEANLARAATLVGEGAEGVVRVIGHTDGKGEDAYNDALSLKRADAVAAWLRARPEIASRAIETEGRGKRDPVAPNTTPAGDDDPAGRARNRRVELLIPR